MSAPALPRNPNADKIDALITAAPGGHHSLDPDWDEVHRLIEEGWASRAE